jgi:nuclear transport factor 2 (NTF2) superfamily protein
MTARPPFPPFTAETARQKVQAAEDAWNTRDPEKVSLAYTEDSVWRNRDRFVTGRAEIVALLTDKWQRELDYALRKELWAFDGNHIAVRFQYESHDASGQWWRSYGNELWEFDEQGLMAPLRAEARGGAWCDVPDPLAGRRPAPREEARGAAGRAEQDARAGTRSLVGAGGVSAAQGCRPGASGTRQRPTSSGAPAVQWRRGGRRGVAVGEECGEPCTQWANAGWSSG